MDPVESGKPLRIAICEDVERELRILKDYIEASGVSVQIDAFANGEAFLKVFTKDAYDIVFLDVYMGEISGVQVAETIRAIDTYVVIVFTTTSDDFTRESYRLNAYKYMIKPIHSEDVYDALELAALKRDRAQGATLSIIADGNPVTIPLTSIEFIESRNRRSVVCLQDNSEYATLTTIDALEKLLPAPRFLRSHRSFIVNLDHVEDVEEDFIMDNGKRAYIRVKDFRKVKRAYDDYVFNSARSE
ncbi:MAG: LytTR family DNA-binding domain-containing protein [Coriobacteriales bacterium]|jgi:DNA-binding LytR/AlgR family response regulator|nr:LytTR family DNA-binding domain-containing protein [Coriobacteriales bacterium]